MRRSIIAGLFALLSAGLLTPPDPAHAQAAVADFYRGRNLTVIVGYSPGGGYDRSRMDARAFLGQFAGDPAFGLARSS